MRVGKLTNEQLEKLIIEPLNKGIPPRSEILVGPSIGEDCSLLDFSDELILVSTDPITATTNNAGKLLLNVCANDIAAAGGEPVGIMVTALIPPHCEEKDVKQLVSELKEEATRLNLSIVGGHTEVTDAVNRIILSGAIIGKVARGKKENAVFAEKPKAGDKILMTKSAGIEGTAILAEDFAEILKEKFGEQFVEKCKKYGDNTSVLAEARISSVLGAGKMHDITEGGVLGACWELYTKDGKGCLVDLRKIPLSEETRKITDFFGISPYELISSGSLIITTDAPEKLIMMLSESGINCTEIGEVIEGDSCILDFDGKKKKLIPPVADSVYSAYSKR